MKFMAVERNDASAQFFDAAERGALVVRQCTECGHISAPRRTTCRACGANSASWVETSGAATLVSWARHPGKADDNADDTAAGGWLFGMVELAKGPWMETTLVGLRSAELSVGLPVTVRFVRGEKGESYPVFGPANPPEAPLVAQ
jgi:uncharacterized OB-fold protein